ncbi:MAG TPA: electron transfer flavoprotein subunit alpha/FixB family protein [Vicinamibacteria bacterium]|nr:electron transfer flavoprotein subunit alpha/FixB family protein [Vicinamibacteria bacterium]
MSEGYPRVDFRNGARGILTWVEVHGTRPVPASLEILRPARELADKLATEVTSVLIGSGVGATAREVIAHGADRVIVVDDPRLAEYLVLPYASVFSEIIRSHRPEIALFGATTSGRELAPRIASRVRAGVTADCTHLEVGDFLWKRRKTIMHPCLEAIRPSYGESKLATIVGFWCPQMATARPGAFAPLPADPARRGEILELMPRLAPDDFSVSILETVRAARGADGLFSAEVIVTGGRPCGELDSFELVRSLVRVLQERGVRSEWGASRQAVDAGYVPHERQIGQTGKTVRPKIYVAVAVSGAVQHLAGMKESGSVVAINKDPAAPIFKNADFGIVGDYREVLPLLVERVRSGFLFGLAVPHPTGAELETARTA